ncbi:MAG: GTP-binding protein [Cyanobacteriota bacterium]|nr:GTP-binding protein [Cyanobacteriota bacterium]
MNPTPSPQETHLNRARASLQQSLSWYSSFRRHGHFPPSSQLQAAVRGELQAIKAALEKLDQNAIRIAAFGLVSRGKSAVLNALLGQKLLPTGPLHGVTRYPKSVRWSPPDGKVQVELIDTPGLDEIQGEARAEMARDVAYQSDLILFVVAGDIARAEYEVLCELRASSKPIILVFNKIDLYGDRDREAIYQQLRRLGAGTGGTAHEPNLLSPEEIVRVAADPMPIPVRVEWPDGSTREEWETPPPQIDELRQKILDILNREGRSLLALNALLHAKEASESLARKTLELRAREAEELIWNYAKYKALAVAVNPIALVDVIGGVLADLALIRALARLYGLPMTSFEAGKLWRKILVSSGGVLLSELGSSLAMGAGKSAAVAHSFLESPAAIATYATVAAAQGAIAGYGAYAVGQVARDYLQRGCSWGDLGPSTVIQEILSQTRSHAIFHRLRDELNLSGSS